MQIKPDLSSVGPPLYFHNCHIIRTLLYRKHPKFQSERSTILLTSKKKKKKEEKGALHCYLFIFGLGKHSHPTRGSFHQHYNNNGLILNCLCEKEVPYNLGLQSDRLCIGFVMH